MQMAVLQARSGSTRLPGKVLKPLLGEPMILRQLERVRRSTALDEIVVATSTHESDDELVAVLERAGVVVRRGSLDDVLSRFTGIVDEFRPTTVVRLTGDNPLVSPELIDAMLARHARSGADVTSNSLTRTFPYGLDVECVKAEALDHLVALSPSAYEREHVTIGMYSRPDDFVIDTLTQQPDESELRWSVDYPEDFDFVHEVYARLYPTNPAFDYRDVLELLREQPQLRRTMADVPS